MFWSWAFDRGSPKFKLDRRYHCALRLQIAFANYGDNFKQASYGDNFKHANYGDNFKHANYLITLGTQTMAIALSMLTMVITLGMLIFGDYHNLLWLRRPESKESFIYTLNKYILTEWQASQAFLWSFWAYSWQWATGVTVSTL